jgi:Putative Flp pilus-assembly TadE/G-like
MRWVIRARDRVVSRAGPEDGVAIIFIAVTLLAILAMTAFVIDFGRVWEERRELQVGAEAAAFAVGEDCARRLCTFGYDDTAVADFYADANATDGAAAVDWVDLDLDGNTVEVETSTETATGSDALDMFFARIVGFDSMTVAAQAKVAWGTPLSATTIPLIISDCEWERTDTGWPAGDPESLPIYPATLPAATLVTLTFHQAQQTDPCNAHPGFDADGDGILPGGFGWLDAAGDCTTSLIEDNWADADPGSSPSTGCSAAEMRSLFFGGPVLIPYFSDVVEQGNNGQYLIAGYGGFVVAGYNFGGQFREFRPPLTGLPCTGNTRCMTGWFVNYVDISGSGDLGGEDRGFTIVKLIG